jgi:homoserine kinase type II
MRMEAMHYYELQGPRVVSTFASERNDNIVVEDREGRRLVVRRFRRNTERDRIAFQLDVQEHLAARQVPTPVIVLTREGERITPGDPPCVAFEYVDGAAFSFHRLAQAKAAARMLARVHDGLDELGHDEVPTPINPHIERWWLDAKRELDAMSAYLASDRLARLEQILGELELAGLQTLPHGLVHGDFHGRNLLFAGDEVVAVLDFDVVHHTVRAADVARALLAFARPHRGSLHVRPEFWTGFLSEYESQRPLTAHERDALPTLLTLLFAPRVEKCELLAAEGENPTEWAASRVDAMTLLARHQHELRALRT